MVTTRTVAQRIASECLGRRARLLSRVVTRLFDEELRDHELKGSQLTLLVALALSPGVRPSQLAEGLAMDKSTLSRNLSRLEARGWVASATGLELTAEGESVLQDAYPAWKRAQKRIAERLGSAGVDALAGLGSELGA